MTTASVTDIPDRPFFTPREFADMYGVHERTVRNWTTSGQIKVVRIGRTVRIPRSELVRLSGE